jgi:hypothetical protein
MAIWLIFISLGSNASIDGKRQAERWDGDKARVTTFEF